MLFLKIDSTAPVITYLSGEIKTALASSKKVLWLVPGGSGIDIAVAVAETLRSNSHIANLTVSLTDERYGPPGHKDSNWQQLKDKGFSLPNARMLPVLNGSGLENTAHSYASLAASALASSDWAIALAGMGADGHIMGIKPQSPAVDYGELAAGYEWSDYQRLSLTSAALKRLDEVVVYAVGKEKWPQFDRLAQDIEPRDQPAQLLKRLKKVTIFNDYKEAV
jgi:6-phosphogluconolactonase/glucosamine-6-phosphate isomerase/deaminase